MKARRKSAEANRRAKRRAAKNLAAKPLVFWEFCGFFRVRNNRVSAVGSRAVIVGRMNKKPPRTKPRKRATARRFLAALDRLLAAAKEAEKARDELLRDEQPREDNQRDN